MRARGSGHLQENGICPPQQGHCKHELTVRVTACIRLAQNQARQIPSMDWGGGTHEVQPLTDELLAIGGF